ncbi:MAG: IS66 family transposase zinc-finger binding domain-containing protein [Lacipirellulaceae bacterium]
MRPRALADGEEVSEQLEYFPASFKVLRHVRPKYGCAKCDHEGYETVEERLRGVLQPRRVRGRAARGSRKPGENAVLSTSPPCDAAAC